MNEIGHEIYRSKTHINKFIKQLTENIIKTYM